MKKCIGYDYGTRPLVRILGDPEFAQHLGPSLQALAYGQLPGFGMIMNPPLLTLIFVDEQAAEQGFGHLKRWANASEDGDAVGLGFVELKSGGYGLCIYPDFQRLLERCVPEVLRDEIDPLFLVPIYCKIFPKRSEAFEWFKSMASCHPFVLAPGTIQGGPLLDQAFRKLHINFFQEDDIPEDAPEIAIRAIQGADETQAESRETRGVAPASPEIIRERRRCQLSRFFPVTLERLVFSKSFQGNRQQALERGYCGWQIDQAACNLVLRHRAPHLFEANEDKHESPHMRILGFVLEYFETVTGASWPRDSISLDDLICQIHADSRELLFYLQHNVEIEDALLQDELRTSELLEG